MKKLSFLWLFFVAQTAVCQNTSDQIPTTYNGFGFRLGFNRLHTLDRNASALLYEGNIPTLSLFYQSLRNGNEWMGQVKVGRGPFYAQSYPDRQVKFRSKGIYETTDSVNVPMRGNNTLLQLSVRYLRDIYSSENYRYQMGGEVSNTTFYPQGFVQPGLMNLASFSPAMGMAYQPTDRQFFSLRIAFPLVNLVSRSTYNNSVSQPNAGKITGFLDQGTHLQSLAKHQEIKVAAAFHFRIGDRWLGGLQYDFQLLKNNAPRDLTIMQNELAFSMQLAK